MACSARPPIWLMSARSRSMSSSNAFSVCPLACCIMSLRSAIAARDVILSAPFARIGEDLGRLAIFDELAEVEERRPLRHARGLLHVVRDDRDRVAATQFVDQLLNLRRGDRVEGRAGLVHQDHFGVDGNCPSNAQSLLLATR